MIYIIDSFHKEVYCSVMHCIVLFCNAWHSIVLLHRLPVYTSPDINPSGWLGSRHQPANCSVFSVCRKEKTHAHDGSTRPLQDPDQGDVIVSEPASEGKSRGQQPIRGVQRPQVTSHIQVTSHVQQDNIREWTGLESAKSHRTVDNREKWRKLVVKLSVVPQRPRG